MEEENQDNCKIGNCHLGKEEAGLQNASKGAMERKANTRSNLFDHLSIKDPRKE